MNILITGGAGFIGSELGKHLITFGHSVKILDNLEYGYRDNFQDNTLLAKNFILADVRSTDIHKHLIDIDIIFHFAGISSLPECETNPTKALEVNTTAVANILNACRSSKIKKFIFASTSAVYENNTPNAPFNESDIVNPDLIYATSKYCAEQLCKSYANNYGMDITICRFFNVYGPHQDFKRKHPPFTSYLIREALLGRTPMIFNTFDHKRDYIYVHDLLILLTHIMNGKNKHQADIFNLSSGKGYSALEIAQETFKALGREIVFTKGDPLAFWDKYEDLFSHDYPLNNNRVQKEVFKHCIGDNTKIIKEFGYTPKHKLTDGIKEIIAYQKNMQTA
jgi:nucleoside-diphosphate-sugar epimerase